MATTDLNRRAALHLLVAEAPQPCWPDAAALAVRRRRALARTPRTAEAEAARSASRISEAKPSPLPGR